MTLEQTKQQSLGKWKSIAPEIRPSSIKNAEGQLQPFYLTRQFALYRDDVFELTVTSLADPFGKIPLSNICIKGRIEWSGDHPIAADAQKCDFIADSIYTVTPLLQGFADVLNQHTKGFDQWAPGKTQSILSKAFPLFGLSEGQIFKEYDLMYCYNDMLFWGARHFNGRGFDMEANRPTHLQIPMVRA